MGTARYLLNEMRADLAALEREYHIRIDISIQQNPLTQEVKVRFIRKKKQGEGETVEEVQF